MQIFLKYNETYGLNKKRMQDDKKRANKKEEKKLEEAIKKLKELQKNLNK